MVGYDWLECVHKVGAIRQASRHPCAQTYALDQPSGWIRFARMRLQGRCDSPNQSSPMRQFQYRLTPVDGRVVGHGLLECVYKG